VGVMGRGGRVCLLGRGGGGGGATSDTAPVRVIYGVCVGGGVRGGGKCL